VTLRFYETFGLVLQSDFAFPDMDETGRRDVDITIRRAALSEPCQTRDFEWQTHDIGPKVQTFVWKTLGTYQVSDGSTIDIDPVEGVSAKHLSIPLFGAVFGTLLHMRGLLVLHASAVTRDGRCVVFLGDKGAGKSTTAFAMIESGYSLLSDDVVAITFDKKGHPRVLPAFNQVKLLDDAARKFGLDLEAAEQIHPLVEKRRHQARDAFCQEPAQATAFYLLDRGKNAAALPFPSEDALKTLIAHSYASRFGRDAFPADIAIRHLHACASLINAAFVGKLVVPDELARIGEIVDLVDVQLAASGIFRSELAFEA
jgi:hypothetical protein